MNPQRSGMRAGAGAGSGSGAATGLVGVAPRRTSRLGDPAPGSATLAVASVRIRVRTPSPVASGAPRWMAATPATCGAAIDVPCMVAAAESLVWYAERIDDPGANRSTHRPTFENPLRVSAEVVEPTVLARGLAAGLIRQASSPRLPAAATTTRPESATRATARSRAEEYSPPRLMFTTPGTSSGWFATIQSRAAATPAEVPEPSQLRTRTGTIVAALATPQRVPASVPATWVPCPWQSPVPTPSEMTEKPSSTRPARSWCVACTPVSTT